MQIMEYFATESEAANILGVNRNTIARWAKEGKLEIQRIGRIGLIPRQQLEVIRNTRKKRPN